MKRATQLLSGIISADRPDTQIAEDNLRLDVVEVRFDKGLIVRPQLNRGRQSGKSIAGRPPSKRSSKTLTLSLDAREPYGCRHCTEHNVKE
jgi:hypothetical protein